MKLFLRKLLFIILVIGFVLGLSFSFYFISNINKETTLLNSIESSLGLSTKFQDNKSEETDKSLPIRLRIPNINVDAKVEHLGLTTDGAMAVPKGPDNVAWFSLGKKPGEKGSAVIAGHRGWKDGVFAVFDNLDKLRKGDKIYVENNEGKVISFTVQRTQIYDKDAYTPEIFESSDGIHLNLITCVGSWDSAKKTSSERFVVFTDIDP